MLTVNLCFERVRRGTHAALVVAIVQKKGTRMGLVSSAGFAGTTRAGCADHSGGVGGNQHD